MAVYVIGCSGNAAYKIGFSNDPDSRLKALQTASMYDLEIVRSYTGGRDLELSLHMQFSDSRMKGEWFDLSGMEDPIGEIDMAVKSFGENISETNTSFRSWLFSKRDRPDRMGDIARDVFEDWKCGCLKEHSAIDIGVHIIDNHEPIDGAIESLEDAGLWFEGKATEADVVGANLCVNCKMAWHKNGAWIWDVTSFFHNGPDCESHRFEDSAS